MAKRDPDKSARLRMIKNIKTELRSIVDEVLKDIGIAKEISLNAIIGSKADKFFNLQNDIIRSSDEYINIWIKKLLYPKYCI